MMLLSQVLAGLYGPRKGKKPRKNYVGRTNRNGTVVTRATQEAVHPDLVVAQLDRNERRIARWLKANPGATLADAPRHIREAA